MVNVLTLSKRTEGKVSSRYLVGPYYVVTKWCNFCDMALKRTGVICLPVRL